MSSDADRDAESEDDYIRTRASAKRARRDNAWDDCTILTTALNLKKPTETDFESLISPLLGNLLSARQTVYEEAAVPDPWDTLLRPLTPSEVQWALRILEDSPQERTFELNVLRRKLKAASNFITNSSVEANLDDKPLPPLTILSRLPDNPYPDEVVNALSDIGTTPFESSFLSRLEGGHKPPARCLFHVDWEVRCEWQDLMDDIVAHFELKHGMPQESRRRQTRFPIEYMCLERRHLDQVHDLLHRSFWPGIDISDCIDYLPEQSTIIASYKGIVVGATFLSSSIENYITYVVVRSGWEYGRIGRRMLYLLKELNPNRDLTLHVSANSQAMLLYNQFGFKAEEFVAGFYDLYLDSNAHACKHAFRMRLRA